MSGISFTKEFIDEIIKEVHGENLKEYQDYAQREVYSLRSSDGLTRITIEKIKETGPNPKYKAPQAPQAPIKSF